jgi:hypothetical protein
LAECRSNLTARSNVARSTLLLTLLLLMAMAGESRDETVDALTAMIGQIIF